MAGAQGLEPGSAPAGLGSVLEPESAPVGLGLAQASEPESGPVGLEPVLEPESARPATQGARPDPAPEQR